MAAKKDEQHGFEVALACQVGIEKAILLGGFQFWITENEKRKSALHFRQGEYWTYDTAKGLAAKYPYLKEKSIYRWLDELEQAGWIKRRQFNLKGVLDKTTWFGRGNRLLDWLGAPNSHFENSISQNENSISQNETTNSQNEKSLYTKETVINPVQTAVINQQTHSPASACEAGGNSEVEEVEAVEVSSVVGDVSDPQTPSCAPPPGGPALSPEETSELDSFTARLQTDRRVIEMLSRLYGLRGEEANTWIAQYVVSQWGANNLAGRDYKDLVMHCQSWIGTKLQFQRERDQRTQQNGSRRAGNRQDRAETGSEIDRIADEYFATGHQ